MAGWLAGTIPSSRHNQTMEWTAPPTPNLPRLLAGSPFLRNWLISQSPAAGLLPQSASQRNHRSNRWPFLLFGSVCLYAGWPRLSPATRRASQLPSQRQQKLLLLPSTFLTTAKEKKIWVPLPCCQMRWCSFRTRQPTAAAGTREPSIRGWRQPINLQLAGAHRGHGRLGWGAWGKGQSPGRGEQQHFNLHLPPPHRFFPFQ
jgi:hypothetical protein